MPSEYIPNKTLNAIRIDLKDRFRVEPLEFFKYNIFLGALAKRYNVSMNTIKKCIDPYIATGDVIIKKINEEECLRSELARNLKIEQELRFKEQLEKDLNNSPKNKEETIDFLENIKTAEKNQ